MEQVEVNVFGRCPSGCSASKWFSLRLQTETSHVDVPSASRNSLRLSRPGSLNSMPRFVHEQTHANFTVVIACVCSSQRQVEPLPPPFVVGATCFGQARRFWDIPQFPVAPPKKRKERTNKRVPFWSSSKPRTWSTLNKKHDTHKHT